MSSFYARCVGLAGNSDFSPEAAVLVLQRRTKLSRNEARVVVYDFLGYQRAQLSTLLGVSFETIRTYWKRIYHKTNVGSREEIRNWVEHLLKREIEGEDGG